MTYMYNNFRVNNIIHMYKSKAFEKRRGDEHFSEKLLLGFFEFGSLAMIQSLETEYVVT